MNGKYEIGALGLAQSFEPTSLVKGGMAPRPKAPAPIGITRFAIPLLALWIIVSASVAGAESSILDYPNPFDNPLHAPLGGGLDFPASVQRDKNHILVSTRDKLIAALEFVHGLDEDISPPILYIEDDAEIDLTGLSIAITRPLILASGRGRDGLPGGLLYVREVDDIDHSKTQTLFSVESDDVHFTGLRIRGPHTGTDHLDEKWTYGVSAGTTPSRPGPASAPWTYGAPFGTETPAPDLADEPWTNEIHIGREPRSPDRKITAHRFRIDNCELWGWSAAAVSLINSHDGVISHNYIHHNQRSDDGGSQGYGVKMVGDARALIAGNVFDHVRHAVAGTGEAGQTYEAAYNFAGSHATSTTFDMHGACEGGHSSPPQSRLRCDEPGGQLAGRFVFIHHNIVLQDSFPAVNIRGISELESVVENNYFAHASESVHEVEDHPVRQQETTCPETDCSQVSRRTREHYSNLRVTGNTLEFRFAGRWVSWGGASSWFPISSESLSGLEVAVGDFDGDGVDDLFRADGNEWWVSDSGRDEWMHLNYSSNLLEHLAFQDFDENGKTDVFKTHAGQWKVSFEGQSSWTPLINFRILLHELRFGHFDHDGAIDVIRFKPPTCYLRIFYGRLCFLYTTRAEISWGGGSAWDHLKTYRGRVHSVDVAIGDFDGDGIDDLLHTTGDDWYMSSGGRSAFSFRKKSGYRASTFRVADFDGDGLADVLASDAAGSGAWKLSSSAVESWEDLNASIYDVRDLEVGDFDGDGRADLLRR